MTDRPVDPPDDICIRSTAAVQHRLPRRLLLLAVGAFAVTSDGTLIVGLLPNVAGSFRLQPATAGLAVTTFAVAYAVGGPVVIRVAERLQLPFLGAATLALFAVANVGTALSPSLLGLLAARGLAGVVAGVFMATAAALASTAAPEGRRGSALALIVGGGSAATAVGVPLGTFLGGFLGWRVIFGCIAVLSVLTAAAMIALPVSPTTPAGQQDPARSRMSVVAILCTTLAWSSGSFVFFTFVAVVTQHTASTSTPALAALLAVFGIAGVLGATAVGGLIDTRGPRAALALALSLVVVALGGFALLAAFALQNPLAFMLTAGAMALYGLGTWGVAPAQQYRLSSGSGAPSRLLLSLNASFLYAGVAIGSGIGGVILALTHSVALLCAVAAGIETLALCMFPLGNE